MPAERRAATLVVVTGDHGESLGEHGESEHGILLYDSTLHVPLVMRGPGVPGGTVVTQQVRHIDLLPTIADLAGVTPPAGLDGVSLVPLLSGRSPRDVPPSYAESRFGELHFGWSPIHSVRDGAWKYIDGPAPELYQVEHDRVSAGISTRDRAATSAALARAWSGCPIRRNTRRRPRQTRRPPTHRNGCAALAMSADASSSGRLRPQRPVLAAKIRNRRSPATRDMSQHSTTACRSSNPAAPRLPRRRFVVSRTSFREPSRRISTSPGRWPHAGRSPKRSPNSISRSASVPANRWCGSIRRGRLPTLGSSTAPLPASPKGARWNRRPSDGALTEGLVAGAAGQRARAEKALRDALAVNPGLAVAHLELGRSPRRAAIARRLALNTAARSEGDAELAEARRALDRMTAQSR